MPQLRRLGAVEIDPELGGSAGFSNLPILVALGQVGEETGKLFLIGAAWSLFSSMSLIHGSPMEKMGNIWIRNAFVSSEEIAERLHNPPFRGGMRALHIPTRGLVTPLQINVAF